MKKILFVMAIAFFLTSSSTSKAETDFETFSTILRKIIISYKKKNYQDARITADSLILFLDKKLDEGKNVEREYIAIDSSNLDNNKKNLSNDDRIIESLNKLDSNKYYNKPDTIEIKHLDNDCFQIVIKVEGGFLSEDSTYWTLSNIGFAFQEIFLHIFSNFVEYIFRNYAKCKSVRSIYYWNILYHDVYGNERHRKYKLFEFELSKEVASKLNWQNISDKINRINYENPSAYDILFEHINILFRYHWYSPKVKKVLRAYYIKF